MKTYLKYLWKKPLKLLWILGTYLIAGAFSYHFFKNISDIMGDGGIFVVIILCLLITAIFIAVTLQPYKEWKDGTNRR